MQNILLNNPLPNINLDRIISPQVLRLLKEKKSKRDIMQLTRLSENQLYSDYETLIKTGQPVSKTDLSIIHEIDFNAFSQCINAQNVDILNVSDDMLRQIQTNYLTSTNHQIDSGFTKVVLVYHEVRMHLNSLNVPYIDYDGNIVVNADKLIVKERQGTLNTTFETEQEYPPFRRNNNYAQQVIDLLFGECVNCDRSYHHYDSHQFEYEPMDFNGYSSAEGTDDGSEEDNSDTFEYEPMEFDGYSSAEGTDDGSEEDNNSDISNDGSEGAESNDDGSDNDESNVDSEVGSNSEGDSDRSDDESQKGSSSDQSNNDVEDGSGERKKRRRIMN